MGCSEHPLTDQSKSRASLFCFYSQLTCARSLQLLARSFKYEFDKFEYLILALTENPGASIVYVTFQYQTKYIANILVEAGIKALPYHAGMSQSSRAEVQERFMKLDDTTVIASPGRVQGSITDT